MSGAATVARAAEIRDQLACAVAEGGDLKVTIVAAQLDVTAIQLLESVMLLLTDSDWEQDLGVAQVNQAIQQFDKVTQQNAAASEEVSSTSEEPSAR